MDKDGDLPGPINLGNPVEFTMKQLAEEVLELTGVEIKARRTSRCRATIRNSASRTSKKRANYSAWQPKVQLRDGLRKTIDYFDALLKEGDPLIVGR